MPKIKHDDSSKATTELTWCMNYFNCLKALIVPVIQFLSPTMTLNSNVVTTLWNIFVQWSQKFWFSRNCLIGLNPPLISLIVFFAREVSKVISYAYYEGRNERAVYYENTLVFGVWRTLWFSCSQTMHAFWRETDNCRLSSICRMPCQYLSQVAALAYFLENSKKWQFFQLKLKKLIKLVK